jgi:hypothetical protein
LAFSHEDSSMSVAWAQAKCLSIPAM